MGGEENRHVEAAGSDAPEQARSGRVRGDKVGTKLGEELSDLAESSDGDQWARSAMQARQAMERNSPRPELLAKRAVAAG
jgi:hypothetical protein